MAERWKGKLASVLASLRKHLPEEKSRLNFLVAAGLTGMVLLCLSECLPVSDPACASVPQDNVSSGANGMQQYAMELEQQLQNLIQSVDGAGQCRVMVTVSAGEETIYATDTEQGETSSRSEHVLLGNEALVESVQAPTIQGVAVLCEGGADPHVQNTIVELVRALTGVGANHITVTKMVTSQTKGGNT